jgi:16S rRNA U516 pseudouridylate synthase RsuA-like enzyme
MENNMTKQLGRPKEIDPTGEFGGTRTIAVTITETDYQKIKGMARAQDVKASKIIRKAISNLLTSHAV